MRLPLNFQEDHQMPIIFPEGITVAATLFLTFMREINKRTRLICTTAFVEIKGIDFPIMVFMEIR